VVQHYTRTSRPRQTQVAAWSPPRRFESTVLPHHGTPPPQKNLAFVGRLRVSSTPPRRTRQTIPAFKLADIAQATTVVVVGSLKKTRENWPHRPVKTTRADVRREPTRMTSSLLTKFVSTTGWGHLFGLAIVLRPWPLDPAGACSRQLALNSCASYSSHRPYRCQLQRSTWQT
jgi:hypothetical protein